jgi:hypothetical protein
LLAAQRSSSGRLIVFCVRGGGSAELAAEFFEAVHVRCGVKPKKKAAAKSKGATKKGEASGGAVDPRASAPTGAVTPDDGTG